jgi:hypothetical protein
MALTYAEMCTINFNVICTIGALSVDLDTEN